MTSQFKAPAAPPVFEQGDIPAVRGSGWFADGIIAATGGPCSHIAGFINADPFGNVPLDTLSPAQLYQAAAASPDYVISRVL